MERLTKHKKTKGKRKHGFLAKMATHGGTLVLKRRREKKRKRLTV